MSSDNPATPDSDTGASGALREKDSKVCKVCGDKALGYNFNAITCESCKAFFRRNALKDKEFKCPFNKNCDINPVTRRFCQLCRLIKCFEMGMRKEYIMSEDDKKEKRKKIEQNRAIKKRSIDDVCDSSNESFSKFMKTEKNKDDDEESKKCKKSNPVKINFLNMASASSKTYQKKQLKYASNAEQLAPFPSPGVPEPSSPGGATVAESRTCNVFNQCNSQFDSNRSRSAEIYQMSKPPELKTKPNEDCVKHCTDSSIIKNILNADASKPFEPHNRQTEEDKYELLQDGTEYVLSQAKLLELAKNNKNLILEQTKAGSRILVVAKDSIVSNEHDRISEAESSSGTEMRLSEKIPESRYVKGSDGSDNVGEGSTPLLSSLINTNTPAEAEPRVGNFRTDVAEEVLQDIPRRSGMGASTSIDSILSDAIKLEYEAYSSMNPRINSRELNDAERAKLNELIVANKALLAPLDDDITGLISEDFRFNTAATCGRPMLVDVLNLTAVAIRRLIKMSKKVNAFKNMCQEDQVALLKGGCTEMMILRSAMTYDSVRDSWKIPHSNEKLMNIKVDVLKEAGGKVFEEHQRFLQTFDPRWRNDENIMLILSAITLFTPDRPRVVHYDVIKLEQNSYYYLLRRYLESIHQGCEARSTFLKLIHKMSELHRLNEDHVRVYLDVNPKDIEPLLIEIFDLKPH